MQRSRPKLIAEKEYFFTHKRKRTFRAVFKRIVRAPANDTLDEYYLECEVDAQLSGNLWNRTLDERRVSILLRPSLVTLIQSAPSDPGPPPVIPHLQQSSSTPSRENWVTECIHSIRSVFRSRKRM